MRLLRHGPPGAEKPALLDTMGLVRDLSHIVTDIDGEILSDASIDRLREIDPSTLPIVTPERIGPCVNDVGTFICVGLNYIDHARETGKEPPTEPILFLKATSAIVGPNDDIEIPRNSAKADWEVELGVIIGTRAKYVEKENALSHVAGYCVVNDVS
jgi:ureidoglycolate lyase